MSGHGQLIPGWGPRLGYVEGADQPKAKRRSGCLSGLAVVAVLVGLSLLGGSLRSAAWGMALIFVAVMYLSAPLRRRRRNVRKRTRRFKRQPDARLAATNDPATMLRDLTLRAGGGVFLGVGATHREWVTADPEHAVMILGPPRSGKTTGIVVPAILSAIGPVVSTSTKLDVFQATSGFRSRNGNIWVYDPSGEEPVPDGAQRLRWSPVSPGGSWDGALGTARVMVDAARCGQGGDAEYWNERAGALLSALLHAAAISGRTIADVRTWVLRHELERPLAILEQKHETLAADVLHGVSRASERAMSGIFSTAASVISAYNSSGALRGAEHPSFDARSFARSRDTIYITAPAHLQTQLAPLVVGLLEEIRYAVYAANRHRPAGHRPLPMLWALDETANIAPLATLPAVVSEGGGQGLQVLACFQDLSQARARWGPAADGFLSLFGTKVVFSGIGDMTTLRAVSMLVGTWDRPYLSATDSWGQGLSWSDSAVPKRSLTKGGSVTTTTRREPILPEGEIANLPAGCALVLGGRQWSLMSVEPYYRSACWQNVLGKGAEDAVHG